MKTTRRLAFPLIAIVGMACAVAGLWFGGLRNETEISATLSELPRPADTPFFRCADSFYWVSYAREMIDTGKLRVRFTQMDNAPYGRPNFGWASLNAWYLVAVAKVWSIGAGIPLREALLPAAMWSGPILYLLALATILGAGWFVGNFRAAAVAVFILGTAPRVYDDFAYAVPGHHGWHDLACFATLVCLAAAIRKSHSQRLFVGAGLAGAVAIWIGATQQAFGLAAAGIGAIGGMLVSFFMEHKRSTSIGPHNSAGFPAPECWRVFGVTGAIAAILFYVMEYVPGPSTMQLEVNHPVYALGFLLGGEFLSRAQRLIFWAKARAASDMLIAVVSAAGLAAIAAAIFFGPAEWHTMRQPFIQRLHQEIAEFQPITGLSSHEWIVILGVPSFLVAAATFRVFGRARTMDERVALLVCVFPCAIAIGLSFVQLRWAGIAGACAAALAAILFTDREDNRNSTTEAKIDKSLHWKSPGISLVHGVCICLSLGLIVLWSARRSGDNAPEVRAQALDRLATMEVASALQSEAKETAPIVIFCDQKIRQAWIGYTDGIRGVGSLYWDSPIGIRDEAEFLATYDDEAAHRIARARGVTHVVTTPNGGSVIAYHYMWQGNKTSPAIRQTLAYRLAAPHPAPPSWLQLLPTSTGAMVSAGIRIYRVL